MTLLRIYLIAILLSAFSVGANGQDPPKAVLVDEFANNLCTEHNRSRIDAFLAELQQWPNSVGYIIGHADELIPGLFHKYFKSFQVHVPYRGFDPKRVKFLRGPDTDRMHFRFWIVPIGTKPSDLPPSFVSQRIMRATLFDSSEIESMKNGTVSFGERYGGSGETCDYGLDLNQFAITANADKDVIAFLTASSKGRNDITKTKTALRLTARNLAKSHGFPANRIKTAFAGSRGKSEMQLWLVPKGSSSPKFREGVTR